MKTLFAVAVASLCAAGTLAVPVTVQNPNFEYPSLNPCGFGASAPGWTGAQVWRPCLPQYFNDFPCAHGVQVGFTNGGPLTQTVSATLQPFTRVVLRTDVGMRLDGFTTGTYRIEVLAGATVIASDESTVVPPPGGFVTATATADVLALVSAVDRPELRINLDLYHTQIGEGDVIRWAGACLPWIGEIQVADNPGRCEPGTGEMNWPVIARALADMGYRGPVGMEAFAKGDEAAALDAFRAAFTI